MKNTSVLFIASILFFSANCQNDHTSTHENSEILISHDSIEINNHDSRLITIVGVGDMMLGTNYPSANYLPPNNGNDLLNEVTPYIKAADLAFGNLEGVILSGKGNVKSCNNPDLCYAFKSPDEYVKHYVNAGFDVLSLANNHMGDFGDIGRENTKKILKENNIAFAGLTSVPMDTFSIQGIKYGFCAFSPNTGTMKINDYKVVKSIIQNLDSISDIVIVSFHGGAEGSKYRHITKKTEFIFGENRGNPYEFARMCIDAGADIIFGHGPHVTRAIDCYKNRFIAYSMGNFATYGRFNLRGVNGLAPIIEIKVDKNGEFKNGKIISTKQLGEGGPVLDKDQKVLQEIIELTASDLPESPILIDSEGNIRLK